MLKTIHGAEKDVYLTGTQQLYRLGQKLETPDGSIFRFTEMGATVGVANNLFQSSVAIANWTNQDASATLDATSITFVDGGTAFVVDEAAGGTLHAEESGDLGATYKVKSNAVTTSNNTVMQLEDGVTVLAAITANAITFIKNPWKDVVISPATLDTAWALGVPRSIIAASGFGWTQSRGVATCLTDGTSVVGTEMCGCNGVVGAIANKRLAGTGSVDNAATTDIITHNAGHTPIASDIHLEYTENPTTAPETRWLNTFSATAFTVNVETDPGAANLDFSWILEVTNPVVGVCLAATVELEHGPLFLKIE